MNKKKNNYGLLTDMSKTINYALGDDSDRSVSNRTAKGLKRALSDKHMDDVAAEDIVHAGMIGAAALVTSKNENAITIGFLLGICLTALYHMGK